MWGVVRSTRHLVAAIMSTVRLRISLMVFGQPLPVDGEVPAHRARLDQLLPFFQDADNRVIERSVARSSAEGKVVSCGRGCSACCRGPVVAITPPEAHALARLVDSMPEPRRTNVKAAFVDRVQRLHDAGILAPLLHRDPAMTREQARDLADRYLSLRLACPFLEDDACTIYTDRPFVCRQHLVTTPPERCDQPFDTTIERVPMPIGFATAMLATTEHVLGKPQYTRPLVLALELSRLMADDLNREHDARGLFSRMVAGLTETSR